MRMNQTKRVLSLILTLTLLLSNVPMAASAEETEYTEESSAAEMQETVLSTESAEETVVPEETEGIHSEAAASVDTDYSGHCGDNLTWKLRGNGKLTISGTGAMWEFAEVDPASWTASTAPWLAYNEQIPIVEVVIESGVTSVGSGAFCGLASLDSVSIPSTVTSIGGRAFSECTGLTGVILPVGVDYIGIGAFMHCFNLSSIRIPGSVTKIDMIAFLDCNSLNTVFFGDSEEKWNAVDIQMGNDALTKSYIYYVDTYSGSCGENLNWTLDFNGVLTISGSGDMQDNPWKPYAEFVRTVVIQDGVTGISDNAFAEHANLTDVTIADSVTKLGACVFYLCYQLKNIDLPESIDLIPYASFCRCTSLETIRIPDNVTSIGVSAFAECSSLRRVRIPAKVEVIDLHAFAECTSLTEVILTEGLRIIGSSAFFKCFSLRQLTIPQSVTRVGRYSFEWCSDLEITFLGDAPFIDEEAFVQSSNITAYYPVNNVTWTDVIQKSYIDLKAWVPYTPDDASGGDAACKLKELTEVDYMAFSEIAYKDFGIAKGKTIEQALRDMDVWTEWFHEDEKITYADLCAHIRQWKVLTDMNFGNIHGFYAVAFENDDGEAIVAYRGSTTPDKMFTTFDGAQDWIVNDFPTQIFNHIWADNNQYELGFYFYETILNKGYTASSIAVTGHSLGGALADIVSARYGCKGVSMNAICILDPIYEYAPVEMGENFDGIDKWNFVDHANWYDIFAGMYEYHFLSAEMVKPVIAHDSNTPVSTTPQKHWYNLPLKKVWEAIGNASAGHSLKSYITKDASGNVVLTKTLYEFKPKTQISKSQSIITSLDLGTTKTDAFNKGLSVTASRTSFGGAGADEIYSSIKADTLIGGRGNDTLDGGRGDDSYVYYKGDGYDIIYDISGRDKIYLKNFSAADHIEVVSDESSDYINIRCNGTVIISIYKKNRDYTLIASDRFLIQVENQSGYMDITELFNKKAYDSHMVIQCPVSVEILDGDGNVVFTLEDGAVGAYYTNYGNFYVFEEEGGYGKSLDLAEGYTARIVGEDTGTMKIEYRDAADGELAEPKCFEDVPVSAGFTATFEQTADGELLLAADTDGDGTVDAKIGYDGSVIPVKVVTIAQEYIVLQPEEQTQLSVTAQPAELADLVCWDVEKGGTEVVSVDADGNVMALKPGTAYILATVNSGINTMVARCRVDVAQPDVQEPEKLKLDGIQLSTNKVTSELFSTDFAEFDILLMLPQNHAAVASATAFTPEHRGVAIESARFADESMARLFELIPLDDRTVAIVPTEAALTDGKAVQSKYISAVTVTVQGEEYTSEALTLTVKKTQPKLKATVAAFNSFWTFQSQKIQITGATVTGISCNDLPEWLALNDMELSLNEKVPTKGSSAKLMLLVETEEWAVPAEVALTVKCSYKTPSLKLNLSSVQMAAANSDGVQLQLLSKEKNKTLEDLGVTGITAPEGYSVSSFDRDTGTFLLEKTGAAPGDKITLKVNFVGTNETLALALSVKTASVVLKPASNSITLNSGTGDSAGIDIAVAPADYRLTAPKIRLENGSKQDKLNSGELGLRYDNGRLYISTTDLTPDNAKYTLYISAEGGKEATVKISTTRVAPTLKLKASGNLDLSFPNRKVSLATTFKNYSGDNIRGIDYYVTESSGKTILNEDARVFTLTKEGEDLYLRLRENASVNVKNTYTLYLTLTLADKSTLESSLKIPVKQTAVALKLSANKLTMNKTVNDKASVAVTCSTKDYDFRIPYLELTDAKGNPSDGLDVSWSDGKVHVAVNEETQFGGSYKIQISPEEGAKAVTLAVSIPTEAKSNVTGTLKATGNLDVIRDGTALTVTPAWKNMNDAERTEELKVFCGTEDVTDLFEITKSNGSYRLARAKNAELDHNGKYTAKLAVTFSNGATAEAIGALKAKMGSAKLTLNSDSTTLFTKDKHSRIDISFASADSTLNKVARVEIKDAKLKEQFEIFDYGNGRYAIGFKDGKVPAKVTNVNLLLEAWLEGNVTAKSNVSAKVKISIVP